MLSLALAFSYHLNSGDYSFNELHPHIRYTSESEYIVGSYYNSDYKISSYVGKTFDVFGYFDLDLAAVSGYAKTLVPYVRVEKDGFFAAPTVYDNSTISFVVGYELTFDLQNN